MCIAIHKPALVQLSDDVLRQCYRANPDGAGFAALTSDGLRIKKGFFTFESFLEAFHPFRLRPALIHFRIATAGRIDKFNCHPWELRVHGHRYAVIHNGMLPHRSSKQMSDTGHFVQEVLRPALERDPECVFRDAVQQRLGQLVHVNNKLVIMRGDGRVGFVNHEQGVVDLHGCWFSNRSYVPRARATVSPIFSDETETETDCSCGPRVHGPYKLPPYVKSSTDDQADDFFNRHVL